MSADITPLTLSPTKAAQYLGLGKTKTLELIRTKRIACYMLDGRIRVSTDACRAFLELAARSVRQRPAGEER